MTATQTETDSSIDWPNHLPRTDPDDRGRNWSLDVTLSKALDDIETQLDRLGVDEDDFKISTGARQRQRDNRPYADASPDDPGFVLRWWMDGHQYVVACDEYAKLRDNARTVGLYLKEKRMMGKRPVVTGESEFSNLRLPEGAGDDVGLGDRPPHEILGVDPDAPASKVRAAFKQRAKETHPDNGGSEAAFHAVTAAREAMLDE